MPGTGKAAVKRFSQNTVISAVLLALVVGTGIGFFATTAWLGSSDQRTSQQRGQDLAILVCDRCHAISTSGNSPDPKAPPFRQLVKKLSPEGLDEQLEVALSLGHSPMPPWKLSPEQATDLLTYISLLKQPK